MTTKKKGEEPVEETLSEKVKVVVNPQLFRGCQGSVWHGGKEYSVGVEHEVSSDTLDSMIKTSENSQPIFLKV